MTEKIDSTFLLQSIIEHFVYCQLLLFHPKHWLAWQLSKYVVVLSLTAIMSLFMLSVVEWDVKFVEDWEDCVCLTAF